MNTWPDDILKKIQDSDDLHIAPYREDGQTYGTLTWIWSVVVDGELYVRAYNGQRSRWYQSAMKQKSGRIKAAGMLIEVNFESSDSSLNDRIDDAYRAKYKSSPYLAPMISPQTRAATVRILPQNTDVS